MGEEHMEFSQWLRRERSERGIDLKKTAQASKVDTSTLSRIENGVTEPTLETVVRIMRGLDIDLNQTLATWVEDRSLLAKDSDKHDDVLPVLQPKDIRAFWDYWTQNSTAAYDLLTGLLNQVAQLHAPPKRPYQEFSDSVIPHFFSESPIYSFRLHYPNFITKDMVFEVFSLGGALTYPDVGAYIRSLRKNQKKTLVDIHRRSSASVMSRIESGNLEKIKFNDVLEIDRQFGNGGEIVMMFVRAAELYIDAAEIAFLGKQKLDMYDLTVFFVTLSRWMHPQQTHNSDWLMNVRKTIR
jgi:transcriptional regulator with XRE-family HTH domain